MRKLAIVGLAVLASSGIACGVSSPTRGPGVDTPTAGTDGRAIVFEVIGEGVGTANSISYGIAGNVSQANDVALPWSKEATDNGGFLIVSLVAQSGSGSGGKITCRVMVDGKLRVENSSEGPYAVVTCTG